MTVPERRRRVRPELQQRPLRSLASLEPCELLTGGPNPPERSAGTAPATLEWHSSFVTFRVLRESSGHRVLPSVDNAWKARPLLSVARKSVSEPGVGIEPRLLGTDQAHRHDASPGGATGGGRTRTASLPKRA